MQSKNDTRSETPSAINRVVAGDDGYSLIKIAYWGQDGSIQTMSIPSAMVRGRMMSDSEDRSAGAYRVGYDSRGAAIEFTAATRGIGGDVEPTKIPNYPESDLNRALVHHALVRAGFGGKDIVLGTALPMRAYFEEGSHSRKMESLSREVVSLGGEDVARLAYQHVYAQAFSAWVDHVIDEAGQPIVEQDEAGSVDRRDLVIGIVDVGGRTTDFTVIEVNDGAPMLSRRSSGSVDLGMLDVMARLKPAIQTKFGLNDLNDIQVEQALRTGKARLWGKPIDVSAEIAEAATETARRLVGEVQRTLGSGANLDRMLFVGGGSVVLREALEREYPHVFVSPDPGFANARGMLKYMTFVDPEAISNAAALAERLLVDEPTGDEGVVSLAQRRGSGA